MEERNEEEEAKRKQAVSNLVVDLQSKDERKIISALKRVPHEGSHDMIEPMLDLVKSKPSDEVRILLEKILFQLKDTACIPPMMNALKNPAYKDINFIIIGAFWQSGLDVSENLSDVIAAAADGDYLTAVEALSVVENTEGADDKQLARSIKLLDAAIAKEVESKELLVGIRQTLVDQLIS